MKTLFLLSCYMLSATALADCQRLFDFEDRRFCEAVAERRCALIELPRQRLCEVVSLPLGCHEVPAPQRELCRGMKGEIPCSWLPAQDVGLCESIRRLY